jgi:tRNA dimethylallyltransferase
MLELGLVAEVRGLLDAGYRPGQPGMNATGYPEIVAYLEGESSLEEAADTIRRVTRRYARRQLTWFRHQMPEAIWLDATLPTESLMDEIVQRWTEEAL